MSGRLLPVLAAAMVIGGSAYIVVRTHHFGFLRALAQRHKLLSWLLALIPMGLVGLFGLAFNLTAMVVVFLHLLLAWLLCDGVWLLVRPHLKKPVQHYWAGAAALAVTVLYLGAGWFFAHHVYETDRTFTTDKDLGGESIRIAALADSHLGITLDGEGFAALLERVQETEPDAVVIVGDFVDDDTDRADMLRACEALGALDTTYGVYFAYGNHDDGYFDYRNFSSAELRQALAENGVTVLEDEAVPLGDSFTLVGRKDRSRFDREDAADLTAELDPSRYIVMLDHQPNDYDAEAAAGADLVISGHTHGGHIFPAGQIGLALGINDSIYGVQRRGSTDFLVTSGVSGWAIPFKTGCISEFVIIDITEE